MTNCLVCSKPVTSEFKPFCSDRCKKVDLNRWLSEKYVIPTDEKPESETDLAEESKYD